MIKKRVTIFEKLRRDMNYTQREFAKKLGVSIVHIGRIEKGHLPRTKVLLKLQELCKKNHMAITIDEILSDYVK